MLYVFILKNGLSYIELPVGILGEKAETVMLKRELADLIANGRLDEAQILFESRMKERPDVLLPGSDVSGELRLTYQILHLCLLEQRMGKASLLSYSKDLEKLIPHYRRILEIVAKRKKGIMATEDQSYLKETGVSEEVLLEVARCMK